MNTALFITSPGPNYVRVQHAISAAPTAAQTPQRVPLGCGREYRDRGGLYGVDKGPGRLLRVENEGTLGRRALRPRLSLQVCLL